MSAKKRPTGNPAEAEPLYAALETKTEPKERTPRRRKCNELDGKAWLRYSISVWSDIKKSAEEMALRHPAMFPSMLVERLLHALTTRREKVVLDPFMGSGSTLVAAARCGKVGIGFDIADKFARMTESRLQQGDLWQQERKSEFHLHLADARDLLDYVGRDSVDICITSPPYWDILNRKRTADYKATRKYSDLEWDLGNIPDYEEFLRQLGVVFEKIQVALRPEKYCVIVVMDIRKQNTFYPYHADIARMMTGLGYAFDDLIIWDRAREYNNLRPLGYPSVFRINKVHEFILLFKTPGRKEKR